MLSAVVLSVMANGYALAQNTFGTLSNFDVFNDTGEETHGFEIELDGIAGTDVSFTFGAPYERYGNPTVVDFNNGVTSGAIVRYVSKTDPNDKTKFLDATPMAPVPIMPTLGHACWTGGSGNYLTAGCEHFGIGLTKNPTATAYRWLVADPLNPGFTKASATKVTVPAPVAVVLPPAMPGGQPVVQQAVPAEPPEAQEFGDAQWVRVFKTEAPDPVELNHLVTDDPAVPGAAEVETEWSLLQLDKNAGGGARKEQRNSGDLGVGKQAVVRRYEFYKYTGAYDRETHEAKPAVNDSTPQDNEKGDYEGAQMAAVNLVSPSATATPTATATATATTSPTATATSIATVTATATQTVTATNTPTATATIGPTATATPLPGQLSAVPPRLNFGKAVYGGLDTQGQAVTKLASIINKSKTSSAPISASATGDFTIVDGGAKGCSAQLAANGKCAIGVKFQPTDFGPRAGILSIGGVHVATLSGDGAAGKIAVSPVSLNFGKVHTGTQPTKQVKLTNKSPVPIEVSDIEILNDTTDFSVDQKCVGALPTQTPCSIMVTFTPSTPGKKSAQLKIAHAAAGSHNLVNLIGTAF